MKTTSSPRYAYASDTERNSDKDFEGSLLKRTYTSADKWGWEGGGAVGLGHDSQALLCVTAC